MNYQEALLDKVKKVSFNDPIGPLISVHEFFTGNTDDYSIAANIDDHPKINEIHSILNEILQDNRIENIYIEITDIDEDQWPYSEKIYIIGNIGIDELIKKLEILQPNEIEEESSMEQHRKNIFNINNNSLIYSVWWD